MPQTNCIHCPCSYTQPPQIPSQKFTYACLSLPHALPTMYADNSTSTPKGLQRSTNINDTVFGNPVYTVPLLNTTGGRHRSGAVGFPLCYEIHGQSDSYFNLISDCCTSVNAHYVAANDRFENVIKVIGVVATDRGNETHYVKVEVNSNGFCEAQVDGQALVNNGTEIMGVSVHHENKLVTISVPNCSPPKERLVMWVYCQKHLFRNNPQTMIKYVINRRLQQTPTAHGLIGESYSGLYKVVTIMHMLLYYTQSIKAI